MIIINQKNTTITFLKIRRKKHYFLEINFREIKAIKRHITLAQQSFECLYYACLKSQASKLGWITFYDSTFWCQGLGVGQPLNNLTKRELLLTLSLPKRKRNRIRERDLWDGKENYN